MAGLVVERGWRGLARAFLGREPGFFLRRLLDYPDMTLGAKLAQQTGAASLQPSSDTATGQAS